MYKCISQLSAKGCMSCILKYRGSISMTTNPEGDGLPPPPPPHIFIPSFYPECHLTKGLALLTSFLSGTDLNPLGWPMGRIHYRSWM